MSSTTSSKIVLIGYLWVNIPIFVIIILSWLAMLIFANLNYTVSALIATVIGWIYWEFAILKWIKWALQNNIEKNRILKIGVSNMFLWPSNMKKIEKVEKKLKQSI